MFDMEKLLFLLSFCLFHYVTHSKDPSPSPTIEIIGRTRVRTRLPTRLECRVTGIPPPLQIEWRRYYYWLNDEPPIWNGRYNATSILDVQSWGYDDKDEDIIVCRAGRTLAASVRLTFLDNIDDIEEESGYDPQDPPKIVVATKGENVTLPCSVFNPDGGEVQWRVGRRSYFRKIAKSDYFSSMTISSKRTGHQNTTTETNLTITNVNASFSQLYRCENSTFGEVRSLCRYKEGGLDGLQCFQLFVDEPVTKQVEEDVMIIRVREGNTAFLPCTATFDDPASVYWFSGNASSRSTLFIGERRMISDPRITVEQPSPGKWDLLIDNVTPADAGPYACSTDSDAAENKTVLLKIVPTMSFDVANTTVHGNTGDIVRLSCAVRNLERGTLIVWQTPDSRIVTDSNFMPDSYRYDTRYYYRTDVWSSRSPFEPTSGYTVSYLSVSDLRHTDAGHYTCRVGYYESIMEQVFTLTVVVPVPTVYFYLSNDTIPSQKGGNLTLSCAVEGRYYMGYEEILWRMPDSPDTLTTTPEENRTRSVVVGASRFIGAAIASNLTIRDDSAFKAGPFSCRVGYGRGIAEQTFLVEKEVPRGSFLVGKTTVKVEPGSSALLSCSVKDLGPREIHWSNPRHHRDQHRWSNKHLYDLQTSTVFDDTTASNSSVTVSNLTILDVTSSMVGSYFCYVNNDQSPPIGQAFFVIHEVPPPYFIPLNTTYRTEEGSDLVLPCAVKHLKSNPILWVTPDAVVADGDEARVPKHSVTLGTRIHWTITVSDLTIHDVTQPRTGRYICRVGFPNRTIDQDFMVVPETPTMIEGVSDTTVKESEGGSATFSCLIRNLFSRVILWRRSNTSRPIAIDDYVFPDEPKYSVNVSRSQSDRAITVYKLTISDLTGSDAGVYMCQVVYEERTLEQFFTLDIPIPSFVMNNATVKAEEGRNITLSCAVRNLGARKIMWRKPNVRSPLAIGGNVFVDVSKYSVVVNKSAADRSIVVSNLTISDLSVSVTGDYICQVLYQQQPIEQRFIVNVAAPSFVVDTTTVQAEEGASATLSCAVKNLDSGVIAWRRPNSTRPVAVGAYVVIKGPKYSVVVDKSEKDRSITVSSLTISYLTGPKAGDYICQVLFEQKTFEKRFTVKVPIPFFDVDKATVNTKEGASATMSCAVKNLDSGVILWRRPNSRSPLAFGNHVVIDDQRYSVTVEKPGSDRSMSVSNLTISDVNGSQAGDYICQLLYQGRSIQHLFTLNTKGPGRGKASAPYTLAPSPASFKSLSLRPVALSSDTVLVTAIGPGKLKNVAIRYRSDSGNWAKATFYPNGQHALVTDLEENTNYVFLARARISGKFMRAFTHVTTRKRLAAVQDVYIEADDSSNSARVSWQYDNQVQVLGFVLKFERSHNGHFQQFRTVTVFNSTSSTIDGLQRNTDYVLKLAPFDDNAVGVESPAFSFQIANGKSLK